MESSGLPSLRKTFTRLSIITGNTIQIAGLLAGCFALNAARSASSARIAIAEMIAGWLLLYFCCHGIAHYIVGRLVGIRFQFYTIGGTGNPVGWPPGLRWIFMHLPFFGVQTEKSSMQSASPAARAMMWSAGVTSSAVVPALGAFWAWRANVPMGKLFFFFSIFWGIGTLSSNWRSSTGDYTKARRALGSTNPSH